MLPLPIEASPVSPPPPTELPLAEESLVTDPTEVRSSIAKVFTKEEVPPPLTKQVVTVPLMEGFVQRWRHPSDSSILVRIFLLHSSLQRSFINNVIAVPLDCLGISEYLGDLQSLQLLDLSGKREKFLKLSSGTASRRVCIIPGFHCKNIQSCILVDILKAVRGEVSLMGLSKTEINLRRLLATAPQQQNQAKLIHYVATLREQLEQLAQETTLDGLPRVSKAKVNDYSEKIEAIAAKLSALVSDVPGAPEAVDGNPVKENPRAEEESCVSPTSGLRRRFVPPVKSEDKTHELTETDQSTPVKLDAVAQAHIEKHRKLQEDLTDEMVGLARQLKESSFLMNQSLQDTEKILDSTETAVERSLASTGHANKRAVEIFSESSKTSCLTWLMMFVMICIFVMVVLLIRIT
ncbi:hypothetical protein NE237_024743 [Protea cynaroides]|uniref:Uncharacterized protein n=1 Tax=Protea cynaroides TaxID=273540 RepID=A0A9Q0JZW9_9MAGN|nr:hypothetical protein NE237_024743 [Protea cynaroides]